MKRWLIIILAIFLIQVPLPGSSHNVKEIEISLNFGKPVVVNGEVKVENATSYLYIPDHPILPLFRKTFVFPPSAILSIDFKFSGKGRMKVGKLREYPEPLSGSLLSYPPDKATWFEYRMGRGLYDGKDRLFLTIFVRPVKHSSGELTYIEKATITISYSADTRYKDTNEEENLLIIAPKEFLGPAYHLANFKRNNTKMDVYVVDLETIYNQSEGRDYPEKIKYYIKHAVEEWKVKYVLLIGTKGKIPTREVVYRVFPYTYLFISDLYYADIYDAWGNFSSWDTNGDGIFGETTDDIDLYPDVYIGRFLCEDTGEAWIVVNKTINYESNTEKNWFKKLVLCGGDIFPWGRDITYKMLMKILANKTIKSRIAAEGEYLGDVVASYMEGFEIERIYATGLLRSDAKFLSKKNINEAINRGCGFVYFAGHGTPVNWLAYLPFFYSIPLPFPLGYTISNVKKLDNGEKLPVMVFLACSVGDFSQLDDPLAWKFVEWKKGGAVAVFASTFTGYLAPGTFCTETFGGYLTTDVFKLYINGEKIAGKIWGDSIVDYLNNGSMGVESLEGMDRLTVEEWILFGDPSLRIG